MYFNLHRSTKTLKGQLTLNIDHLVMMENSAVGPGIHMVASWNAPTIQNKYSLHGDGTPQ